MSGKYWDITVNAFRGCSHASRGCDNCWAERFAWRLANNPKTQVYYKGLVTETGWTGKTWHETHWDAGLPSKPKKILFNAMGDLFHEANKPGDIQDCLQTISLATIHTFIIPTKRPGVALYHLQAFKWKLDNVVLLGSVEDQPSADERLPYIVQCRPFVKAVGASIEPLVGGVSLAKFAPFLGYREFLGRLKDNGDVSTDELRLDWVICGGETGPGARPMHADWARSLRDKCKASGVPFFFKQWGEWRGTTRMGVARAGRVLDGVEHNGGIL